MSFSPARCSLAICAALGLAAMSLESADAGETLRPKTTKKFDRCAAYGEGFTAIDGMDTCIKVSGHVRVEMTTPSRAASPNTGWDVGGIRPAGQRSSAGGDVDMRHETPAGPVRGFVRLRAGHSAGLADPFGR
jgi:hypothetical protein